MVSEQVFRARIQISHVNPVEECEAQLAVVVSRTIGQAVQGRMFLEGGTRNSARLGVVTDGTDTSISAMPEQAIVVELHKRERATYGHFGPGTLVDK